MAVTPFELSGPFTREAFNERIAEVNNEFVLVNEGIDNAATTATLLATLTTTWTGSSAPFTQTVSVADILVEDNPIIDVVLSSDVAASKLILDAWANVSRIVTSNGSITAYCYESKPAVAIPLQLKVVR